MIGQTYKSRLKNSRRNVFFGLFRQLAAIILTFAIRTVIIFTLGADYQGLSGLFTSILHALNLSELGFSAAVTFVLYKPIAEDDWETVCAILAFLKKVYRIIGLVILLAGIIIMPFVPLLIKGDYPQDINIYVLYFLYLINSVITYLVFADKNTFLTAMQRNDLVSKAYAITDIIGKSLQILVLILFKNYYVCVLMLLLTSVANNFLTEYFSRKAYPQIAASGVISGETKDELIKNVKAVFLNKIGDVARNSFDNVVISAFLGLTAVTVYENYYLIYASLYGIMGIIVHAVRASVGNSLVRDGVDKNYKDMLSFSFIFMWIVGWFSVCMLVLYQPFMYIWMKHRDSLMLGFWDMLLFCLYFYSISMAYTKNVYLEAKGLFHESRHLYILEAVGNLVLNIVLGYLFGITGILLATIFTIFVFNFACGTGVLFRHYFKRSTIEFSLHHLFYFTVTVVAGLITYNVANLISVTGIPGLIMKAFICLIVPNIVFITAYFKWPEFASIKRMMGMIGKR